MRARGVVGALVMVMLAVRGVRADDASTLSAEAAALQERGEWIQARHVYEKLEKLAGQEGRALYLQAFAASEANQFDDALALTMRAVAIPGAHLVPARLLYADLLERNGEHARAKDLYIAIYKVAAGDTKTIAASKLATLNAALKLPATDGITTNTSATPPASPTPSAPAATATAKNSSTVTTTASLEKLTKDARAAEAAHNWEVARTTWERVEKQAKNPYPGFAVYKQAYAAFQLSDLDDALRLAQRASSMPGAQRQDAKILYGDCLFKQGDYKRAKEFFLAVRKMAAPDVAKALERKIASVNAKLQLPATDGL